MESVRIAELIAKYNEGLTDPSEVWLIEQLIEKGEIELTQLRELTRLEEQLIKASDPSPSLRTDDAFYAMLANEKKNAKKSFSFQLPDWNVLLPRLAFSLVLLIAGFTGGYWLQRPMTGKDAQVQELTDEVSDLKEMVMLSLLEKESASDRLKAVSLTSDMSKVSDKVSGALLETLNNDENVNVRLAALEALKPYVKNSDVRMGLIRSIASQDSPLVQLELAALMVTIQEKKSVGELKKLLENENTPREVKNKIRESIDVLI